MPFQISEDDLFARIGRQQVELDILRAKDEVQQQQLEQHADTIVKLSKQLEDVKKATEKCQNSIPDGGSTPTC